MSGSARSIRSPLPNSCDELTTERKARSGRTSRQRYGASWSPTLTYLFWVDNLLVHAILVGILAIFIALLVFLTAAMDNPFRGDFSISADAYQSVLENVMSRGRD